MPTIGRYAGCSVFLVTLGVESGLFSIGGTATGWMMRQGLVPSSGSSDYPLMNETNRISKAGGMIAVYKSGARLDASLRSCFLNRYRDVRAKALAVLCEHPLKIDAAAVP